jgi:carboxypeptidase family protein/TonB-dependent receptor-like protein
MHSNSSLFRSSRLMRFLTLAFGILLLLAGIPAAFGQVDRAELEGTVTDASGSVVVGADVKIVAVDTGLSDEQKTNSKGYYRFPGLAVGDYKVSVASTGFKTKVVEGVVLRIGQTHTLDVQLAVGAISEQIEVKASNAPSDRSSAEAATVIDTTQIANLPNNGRDWSSFTLLAPFAQDDGGGDQRTIRFAGRARDDNNFSIDGVDAGGIQEQAQKSQTRLQISQDAIEEYRVSSALYDAEYGTQSGGQIDVETKSGTNNWHGTVFGYFRNSIFDARNFNDYNVAGQPAIPPFRLGQYGFTVGGPIKKNKTFFFISYEGLRQLQSITSQFTVPSGACCANPMSPTDPTQGTPLTVPFQQAVLSQSPQMCTIMQAYPWRASVGSINGCSPRFTYPDSAFTYLGQGDPTTNPNYNADADTLTAPTPTTVHEDTWLVRLDHQFSERTLLYGRAGRDINLVDGPNGSALPGDKVRVINHPANYLVALQHSFAPNLFNETKGYINRSPFHNPQASVLTFAVGTPNFVGLNDNTADIEIGSTFGFVDNLTWVRGRNAFKMGMEYRRVRLNQGQTADNNLSFNSDQDIVDANLTGGIKFIAPWCCHRLRRNFIMPYFQDEWKATPTLTLTAGLRWDYYGVAHEATNRTTVFDLNVFHGVCLGSGSFNVAPSPGPINTAPCPTNPALYNPNYKNFDPRVALAWSPSALHGKTVFRAGFGIYHGAAQNDDLNAGLESDTFRVTVHPPVGGVNAGQLPLEPAYEQTVPDLSSIPAGTNPTKVGNQFRALQREGRRDLYSETWGFTVEHELPSNFTASAQYLGSRGVRLFSRGGVNLCTEPVTLNPVDGDCVRTLDAYFPAGNPFASTDYKSDIGSSTYNALGLSIERRFSKGLEFQGRYTWSHSINDGSVGGGESNGPENVNCLPCDKGPSVFDIRNNVAANLVYELPFGPGKSFLNGSGVLGKIVGGWELSSVGLWHTGHPLTVAMDLQQSNPIQFGPFTGQAPTYLLPDGNDQTTQRPDLIPGVPLLLPHPTPLTPASPGSPMINAAAFAPPPTDVNGNFTRFGDAPNGVFRAVNSWQIDFALTKETKLTERVAMEFAVQAFNIFNHTQLADPGDLNLYYNPPAGPGQVGTLTPKSDFGIVSTFVNFNINNDNQASPNTGTGLPRQLQFMVRVKF